LTVATNAFLHFDGKPKLTRSQEANLAAKAIPRFLGTPIFANVLGELEHAQFASFGEIAPLNDEFGNFSGREIFNPLQPVVRTAQGIAA
jgi:hypothetical protein